MIMPTIIGGGSQSSDASHSHFNSFRFDPSKLARFWSRLSKIDQGGLDVLCIGDSLFRGQGTTNPDTLSIPDILRTILQNRWNPTGVMGGAGFLPSQWTWGSPPTQPMAATNADLSGANSRVVNGAGNCLVKLTSGGSAGTLVWAGSGVTDLEAIHLKKNGSSITAGWAMTGSETGTGTLNISDGTAIEYGRHTVIKAGMSAANSFTLTMSEPASDDLRFSGVIRYRNDFGAGIRVHNLACSGMQLYDAANNNGYYRGDEMTPGANTATTLQANIDQWTSEASSTSTAIGARRGALIICELLTNDQGNYGNTGGTVESGRDAYRVKLDLFVQYCASRPSQPSVLLVIPPCPLGRETYYRVFKQAVIDCSSVQPNVAVLDLDFAFREITYGTLPPNWILGDGIHYSDAGYGVMAGLIAQNLVAGRFWASQNLSL